MALEYGIGAVNPSPLPNVPHFLGFETARTASGDTLFEVWNGDSDDDLVLSVDKDGNLVLTGDIDLDGSVTVSGSLDVQNVLRGTTDGSDDSGLFLSGAGATSATRGAFIELYGNESGSAGALGLNSGNHADAHMLFRTSGTLRMTITSAGAVVFASLPTGNPNVAGQIWNDSGTLKVSAG